MSSSAGARALMQRRAAALAQPPLQEEHRPFRELLVVSVASRRFALDIRHVQQILSNGRLCALPANGGDLLGVVAARGDVVPVADLAAVLDLAPADPARSYLVIVDGAEPSVGLLVDEVSAVERVADSDIRRQPGSESMEYGVMPDGAVALDVPRLLAAPRLTHRTADHPASAPATADGTNRGEPCPT